jgi:hypothetical protein
MEVMRSSKFLRKRKNKEAPMTETTMGSFPCDAKRRILE